MLYTVHSEDLAPAVAALGLLDVRFRLEAVREEADGSASVVLSVTSGAGEPVFTAVERELLFLYGYLEEE